MKVTGLPLIITLGLVVTVFAHKDYNLQCSREEMGIRWPSYKSNSEYYVCHRLGDRPMAINCNAGEVFTFVLQVCTSPSRYIPAPTLDILPTSSPVAGLPNKGPFELPPLLVAGHPNVQEIPHPPMVDAPKPPYVTHTSSDNETIDVIQEEHKPLHPAKPQKPGMKPPMPPTPAPTPPVVANGSVAEKPNATLGKKPSSPKKPSKKTPSKKTSSKKGKNSKNTKPKPDKKAPKKPAKNPVAPAKKAPKASTGSKSPKGSKVSTNSKAPKASKNTKVSISTKATKAPKSNRTVKSKKAAKSPKAAKSKATKTTKAPIKA